MTLSNAKHNFSIELKENVAYNYIIENPEIVSYVYYNIWRQCNGEEGEFILAEKDKILAINKVMIFVNNLFSVNCNDKKIINVLYAELKDIIVNQMIADYTEINCALVNFVDKVIESVPYNL